MPDSELAVVSQESFLLPTIIACAGPSTRKKFFEFFTVPIRNAKTRAAYYRQSKLYDRTKDEITLSEVERIRL
jgi:hypothetical protein